MSRPTLIATLGARQRTAPTRIFSAFEFWPAAIFYAPIALQWALLGLRYGNPFLLTAANPLIESGGLCGESKTSILDQVGKSARDRIAPYRVFTVSGDPHRDLEAARAAMAAASIELPLVAKPDIGCNGVGVTLIRDEAKLALYCAGFPAGERVVLQRLVDWDGDAGIFYIRGTNEQHGRISSLTLKSSPYVIGDGVSTLAELIERHPRAGRLPRLYKPRLAKRLAEIPSVEQRVPLVFAGNHRQGSVFRDGNSFVTPALTARIDAIARAIPEFHFGRFDVRFRSLELLKRGEGFSIVEINGVGSEATHIWDKDTTLTAAYTAQFEHYAAAFAIGADNRRRGFRPTAAGRLWRLWRRQKRLMANYPQGD